MLKQMWMKGRECAGLPTELGSFRSYAVPFFQLGDQHLNHAIYQTSVCTTVLSDGVFLVRKRLVCAV